MKTIISHGDCHFIDLPEFFLLRYAREINAWAQNIRQIGLVKSFILREGHLADLSPNEELGAQLIQVKVKCQPTLRGVEISPLEERDRMLIWLHCEKLQKAGLPADAFTPEPERPWIPFLPTIDPVTKH